MDRKTSTVEFLEWCQKIYMIVTPKAKKVYFYFLCFLQNQPPPSWEGSFGLRTIASMAMKSKRKQQSEVTQKSFRNQKDWGAHKSQNWNWSTGRTPLVLAEFRRYWVLVDKHRIENPQKKDFWKWDFGIVTVEIIFHGENENHIFER